MGIARIFPWLPVVAIIGKSKATITKSQKD
jgi:hypothetical protein